MTTSYHHTGGSGDRRSLITATTTVTCIGTFSTIIDGTKTNSLYFSGGESGKEMLFDFGAGAAATAIIDEFTYYQDSAVSQGTWTFRASDDNATWTNLATGLDLGGAYTDVHAFTNTTGYRYYSLLQTAGSTSSGPWVNEIEFKIDGLGAGDALWIDGEIGANFGSTTSGTVTLTTEMPDDIIVVVVHSEKNGVDQSVASVSGGGLTWTRRKQLQWVATGGPTMHECLETWWAHAPTALTAEVLTITLDVATDDASIIAFGVQGCTNFSAPWDSNGSLPGTDYDTDGTNTSYDVPSLSTDDTNTLLLGFAGSPYAETFGAGTGYVEVGHQNNSGGTNWSRSFVERKYVSAPQSSVTAAVTGSYARWGMIADALSAGAAGGETGTVSQTLGLIKQQVTAGGLEAGTVAQRLGLATQALVGVVSHGTIAQRLGLITQIGAGTTTPKGRRIFFVC